MSDYHCNNLAIEAWLQTLTPEQQERLASAPFEEPLRLLRAVLFTMGIVVASGGAFILVLMGIEAMTGINVIEVRW